MQVPFSGLFTPANIKIKIDFSSYMDYLQTDKGMEQIGEGAGSWIGGGLGEFINVLGAASFAFKAFSDLKYEKVAVDRKAVITAHPVEDGSTISDNKIFNPIEIEVTAICPSSDDFKQLIKLYKNKNYFYSVYNKNDTIDNCIMSDFRYQSDASMISATRVTMRFVEIMRVATVDKKYTLSDVKSAADTSVVNVHNLVPSVKPSIAQAAELYQKAGK